MTARNQNFLLLKFTKYSDVTLKFKYLNRPHLWHSPLTMLIEWFLLNKLKQPNRLKEYWTEPYNWLSHKIYRIIPRNAPLFLSKLSPRDGVKPTLNVWNIHSNSQFFIKSKFRYLLNNCLAQFDVFRKHYFNVNVNLSIGITLPTI